MATDALGHDDESKQFIYNTSFRNLPYTVPVYDGRKAKFSLKSDVDNLEKVLDRYNEHDGEVPNGACVVIGYTVTQFPDRDNVANVGLNIMWVIVIGEPNE